MFDRARLIKLLNLSTSDSDGEALSAIRMANKMIRAANQTWDKLIGAQQDNGPRVEFRWGSPPNMEEILRRAREAQARAQHAYGNDYDDDDDLDSDEIEEMLDACLESVHGSARTFIESLDTFYKSKGFLTPKQRAALKKFYDNIK